MYNHANAAPYYYAARTSKNHMIQYRSRGIVHLFLFFLFVVLVIGGAIFISGKLGNTLDQSNQRATSTIISTSTRIHVFFSYASSSSKQVDCSYVYPVERSIDPALEKESAALQALFAGPTAEEQKRGFSSLFSKKTEHILRSIRVQEGIAYVDLEDIRTSIPNVSASCGSAAFLSQIGVTLKELSDVRQVLFAIHGDPKTFYEWIQIGCTAENNFCDATPFRKGSVKTLPFEIVTQGMYGNQSRRENRVATNKDELALLWKKTAQPASQMPKVNFSENQLIGVFYGSKNTGGYEIKIIEVDELDDGVEVIIKETVPGKECIVSQSMSQPFYVIQIQKTEKPIDFRTIESTNSCS